MELRNTILCRSRTSGFGMVWNYLKNFQVQLRCFLALYGIHKTKSSSISSSNRESKIRNKHIREGVGELKHLVKDINIGAGVPEGNWGVRGVQREKEVAKASYLTELVSGTAAALVAPVSHGQNQAHSQQGTSEIRNTSRSNIRLQVAQHVQIHFRYTHQSSAWLFFGKEHIENWAHIMQISNLIFMYQESITSWIFIIWALSFPFSCQLASSLH